MPHTPAGHGIILFAHGSRDPLWRQPIEAVREHLLARQPRPVVRCAYLELCTPTLEDAVRELAGLGLAHVAIVPMFLGAGRPVREDLPQMVQALAGAHPRLRLALAPPVGEDARLVALMAQIAVEAASIDC